MKAHNTKIFKKIKDVKQSKIKKLRLQQKNIKKE